MDLRRGLPAARGMMRRDLADERGTRRTWGAGRPGCALLSVGAPFAPSGGRGTHSPARSAPHDCRARDRTENSQRDLPFSERGLPSACRAARPQAPLRVQGASPTIRAGPAASSGRRIQGCQSCAQAKAPPACVEGDQAPRREPCARCSQQLGGLARYASRSSRQALGTPGHQRARATGHAL